MGGEPVLADIGAVNQPAVDQVPAERALWAAKHEEAQEPGHEGARDIAGQPEAKKRQEKHEADEAPEKAMRPLPPIEGLERLEAHPPIDLSIFRDLLVSLERLLPVGLGQRRNGADDRLPLGL